MKISVITVTKNNKEGLLRAIESVRSQTYKNVEHIIVDGGSTDGTVEAINNEQFTMSNLQLTIHNEQLTSYNGKVDRSSRMESSDLKDQERFLTPSGIRNDKEQRNILRQAPHSDKKDDSLRPDAAGRQDDKEVSSRTNVRDLKISRPGGQAQPLDRDRNDKSLSTDHFSLVFISEKDNGIYDAINKGIKLATGDVIGLLHSDDFYADEFVLERYAEVFQDKNIPSSSFQAQSQDLKEQERFLILQGIRNDKKYVEAVYSDLVYVKEKSNVKGQKSKVEDNEDTDNYLYHADYSVIRMWKTQEGEFTTEEQRHREILKGWMPPHPTLFVRREVFEKYGLYRTDMKIAADYEMILKLFFKNKITAHYLPIITYCMTIGGASNKSLKNIIRKSSEDFYAMKLHGIPFPFKTLLLKNFRKLPQFIKK